MAPRKLSIAFVLSAALLVVTTLLLSALAAVVYGSERDQRWSQLRNMLAVSADQQAAGLALPMWNLDLPHVQAIMRSGMRNREIFAVAVVSEGQRYVLVRDAAERVVAAAAEPADEGLLLEERSIEHGGEAVGRVRVFATSRLLQQDLDARRHTLMLFIVAFDAALVGSLYALLWFTTIRPVRALERFAGSVKAGRPAEIEAGEAWFFGELRGLADSLRDMIRMLDSRYQALRESEERLSLAASAASIGIWDWDVLKNELKWDDRMYALYGIRREDFSHAYDAWSSALTPQDFERANEAVAAALRGDSEFAIEFSIRRPDGAQRVIKGEATTIRDAQGRALRMVGVNLDITERKRAEQEIRSLNAELEQRVRERTAQLMTAITDLAQARDQAESATRAKSEFLANMSHEIRTPMNAILGMTDLALRTELSPKQRGYLGKARIAAESLLVIINDILDFSKIEAGKLEMESREFALQSVLDRVTAVVGLKAQEKGLELLLNTAPDVPPTLVGDPLRLEQVLVNLCSNAVKFTAHGEIVVVTVKSVVASDEGVTLRFSVRDTGVGMSEAQVANLFQPFNQLDASTTRLYGGTGLGLAICRKLVGLMGGEIGVKSQPGKGSDFHFTARFGVGGAEAAEAGAPLPALHGLRVLVVDDSANSREIFDGLLRGLGCGPMLASTPSAALAELGRAAGSRPFDLVIVDWKMPEMDGFELVERVRALALPASPKLVMATAYGDEELVRRATAARLDGCLSKPVSASTLLDTIMNCCGGVAPSGAAAAPGGAVAPAVLRGRRLLLVEDNEFNQIVAAELLRDVAGAQVVIAGNGQEAIERLTGETFDAVLMDVQMPVMDGYQATARIRQLPAHAALPIIAMTAHAMVRDRDQCLAVGMNDYVTKPFEPQELFGVLARWLDPTAGEGELMVELGLQRCMGRRELYERIAERFLSTRLDEPRQLREAVAAREFDRASALAHSIVSTAGTLGAEALAEAARTLQLALDAGETERWPGLLAIFEMRHERVVRALRARAPRAGGAPELRTLDS